MIHIQKILLVLVVLLLAGVNTQARQQTADPYDILQKHYAAMGGLDKLKAEKTSYFEGDLTIEGAGLRGKVKQWVRTPDQNRQELDLTIFKQTVGTDGKTNWTMDANGKVSIQKDEAAIKRQKIETLLAQYEHLDPQSPHFDLFYEGTQQVEDKNCHVIKITNTINEDIRLEYYDTANYYLVKQTLQQPDNTIHTMFSDYRDIDGIRRPFHNRLEVQPLGQKMTIRVSQYRTNIDIDPALFAPPQQEIRDFRFAKGESAENIPFQFIEHHLFIPVTIQGKESLWCIDSGASMSVIDSDYALELGLTPKGEMKGRGAGTTVKISFVTIPAYNIPGIRFDQQKIAAINISGLFRKHFGMEVAGLLGYDFLSRFVTRIDYANERLSFYAPDRFTYTDQGQGKIVEAPLKGNLFAVPMAVDGKYSGRWALDLGAGGTSFHYPAAEKYGFLNLKGIEQMGEGAGGEFKTRTVQFQSLEFAGFSLPKPLFDFPLEKGVGAFASQEILGNIGNALLRHFVLYLDYQNQRVIVEKGEHFGRRFPRDKSGLQIILTEDNRLQVNFVSPHTPAARAGFLKGDIVRAIDHKDVAHYGGILEIRQLLRQDAGTRYIFKVLRNNKPHTLKLKLQNLF
jgi:outer membrane lipoprotein-sorting protein